MDLYVLDAPRDITAAPLGFAGMGINWQDIAFDDTGETLDRSTDGTIWTTIASLAAGTDFYDDTSATPGDSYYYGVENTGTNDAGGTTSALDTTTVAATLPAKSIAVTNKPTAFDANHKAKFGIIAPGDGAPAPGGLTISVLDSNNNPIIGGSVTASTGAPVGNVIPAEIDDNGLPSGTYIIKISAPGYAPNTEIHITKP